VKASEAESAQSCCERCQSEKPGRSTDDRDEPVPSDNGPRDCACICGGAIHGHSNSVCDDYVVALGCEADSFSVAAELTKCSRRLLNGPPSGSGALSGKDVRILYMSFLC